jgi:hypothetical protein
MHTTCSTARLRAFRHMLLGASALIGAGMLAAPAQAETGKWSPYFQIEAKPGSERQIGRVEMALPLWQDSDSLLFLDARGLADLDDNYEGNLGIAYRSYVDSGTIFGMNFFADYRDTAYEGLAVGQLGAGIELMTERFGFTANGYMPENKVELLQHDVSVDLASVTAQFGEARALPGFDAEISYGMPVFDSPDNELRLFAGGYYFDAEHFESVAGPRLRAELRLFDVAGLPTGSRVVVGAEYTYDQQRDHQAFGLAQLRIPLSGAFGGSGHKLTGLDRRMQDSIRRDPDILIGRGETDPSPLTNQAGDQITDIIFLDEGGKGLADGSSIDDPIDFDTYFAGAPVAGALHVVLGEDGEIQSTGASLLDGQQFVGGGGTIGLSSMMGVDLLFNAPGDRPTLHNEGNGTTPIFTLAADNTLAGMDFRLTQADGADGSYIGINGAAGTANNNIVLTDLYFANDGTQPAPMTFHSSQIGGEAIRIEDGSNVTIDGITADDMFGEAIDLRGVDTAMLTDITVNDSGRAGILFGDAMSAAPSMNITLDGFSVTNPGNIGVAVFNASNVTIENGTIDGAGAVLDNIGQGVNISGSDTVAVDNVMVLDSTRNGILVASGGGSASTNVTITGTTVDGARTGIQVLNSEADILDTMVTNATQSGIFVDTDDPTNQSDVTITGTTVTNTGVHGVSIVNSMAWIDTTDVSGFNQFGFNVVTNDAMAVADVTITDSSSTGGQRGLYVADSMVNANGLDISNVTQRAVYVETTSAMTIADVTFDNATIDNANHGIYVLNSNFSSDGVTMTNIGTNGVLVESMGAINTADATLTDISIDGAGSTGIIIRNATAAITNAMITDSGVYGINLIDNDDTDGHDTDVSIDGSTISDMSSTSALRFQGGGELNVSGTGNTVTSATTCTRSAGITVTGSVDVNGNPEPATSCP